MNTTFFEVNTITKEHVLNWRTFGSEGLHPGGFTWSLIDAMGRADSTNFEKLASAYPELAAAMQLSLDELRN